MTTIIKYTIDGTSPDLFDFRNKVPGLDTSGQSIVMTGSNSINTIWAAPGVDLDARNLLGGEDVVLFSKNWADYTKDTVSVTGAIVFSYTNPQTGLTEKVTVSNGALSDGQDKLVFADGSVLTQNASTAWPTQSFMSRESYNISKRHWVRVRATRDKTRDVRDIEHHHRTNFVSDFLKWLWF